MSIIKLHSTDRVIESDSISGYKLEAENGQKIIGNNERIIELIKSKQIYVDNLEVLKIDGVDVLVDQEYLTLYLNQARKAYEQGDTELISNTEYDRLYDRLKEMESINGTVESDSPTINVGYEVQSKLEKYTHKTPIQSLDKVKDKDAFRSFIGDKEVVLGLKMDGLTVVSIYNNGKLESAITRGNGIVGEVVTSNFKQFKNIPLEIPYKGHLVIRGEAVILTSDFNRMVACGITLSNGEAPKNSRNLCSGSVRQLNSKITAERNVRYYPFSIVEMDGGVPGTLVEQLEFLRTNGFEPFEYKLINAKDWDSAYDYYTNLIKSKLTDIPCDGLVGRYNDISYGDSLGTTSKFPKHSLAFKWEDDRAKTNLITIEWSASRTGLLNPVAIFKPVDIEGSTIQRASAHNVSIVRELELGYGDEITVYKANMIIPQIYDNLTRTATCEIPSTCPICHSPTEIIETYDEVSGKVVQSLYCTDPECPAKQGGKFVHFVKRDAMNIDGISEKKIEKLQEVGILNTYADFYRLSDHYTDIVSTPGFGEQSYQNMIDSIDKSRKVAPANLIYALSIPHVGFTTAKTIAKHCKNDLKKMINLTYSELISIPTIGDQIAESYSEWFSDDSNREAFIDLYSELEVDTSFKEATSELSDLIICIHGSLEHFSSRRELKDIVESMGGKLASAVSNKTTYLVTNHPNDNNKKNREARELNIPIISEQEFIDKYNIN